MRTLHDFIPAPFGIFRAPPQRRSVYIRAVLRIAGSKRAHPITVREISPTQIRGSSAVGLFVGSQIEIELGGLSTVSGQVIESLERNAIAVRLDSAIDPDFLHLPLGGSRGAPPTPAPASLSLHHA